jgi:DNA-binding transcriptional LysR family regulator
VLDWNDLRYFLAIARAGTLAGAARELRVEHTTVGRRLSAIETALGARLFTRGPDGFTLTDAGTEILPLAEEVAARIERIERCASGADARIEGTVRLTTSESMGGYIVPRLRALRERHSALIVEVLSGNRAFDLMRGEADLAIRVRDVAEPELELVARTLVRAAWSLYASPSYVDRKGALEDPACLRGHDVVGFDPSLGASPGGQWIASHGAGASIVLRANSIVAALNAAIFGMGIAALPCFVADPERALVRLTTDVIGTRNVLLVVHPDLARVARVRAVMDYFVDVFERDAPLWRGEGALREATGADPTGESSFATKE